jgi:hypothetical protein
VPGSGVALAATGERASSLSLGRQVVGAATRDVDTTASTAASTESDWRRRYATHLATLTRLESHHHAGLIAGCGLAAAHDAFVYERDGEPLPLQLATGPASTDTSAAGLDTLVLRGDATRRDPSLSIPYHGTRLQGATLHRQLDTWVERGTVEPDAAEALRDLTERGDWLDLSDVTVVVLGAGAQMGPLRSLLRWGAHVVAVDVPGATQWQQILDVAATSAGRLSLPVSAGAGQLPRGEIAQHAGVDVVADLPRATAWLRELIGTLTGPVTLGTYVYADGLQHVRATMAVDALTHQLMSEDDRLSLAFLATPTDVYAVPIDVVEDSRRRYDRRAAGAVAAHGLSAGRLFTSNYPDVATSNTGDRFGLCDALVMQQGPNYALAKRIQRWRATQAWLSGRAVSINVAPATRTRSVVRNRLLAAAYAGAPRFGLEVFDPSTSSTLMAALLVHDLRNPRPPLPHAAERSEPYRLFTSHAVHGGMWRSGYAARSVLGAAVVMGMVSRG